HRRRQPLHRKRPPYHHVGASISAGFRRHGDRHARRQAVRLMGRDAGEPGRILPGRRRGDRAALAAGELRADRRKPGPGMRIALGGSMGIAAGHPPFVARPVVEPLESRMFLSGHHADGTVPWLIPRLEGATQSPTPTPTPTPTPSLGHWTTGP